MSRVQPQTRYARELLAPPCAAGGQSRFARLPVDAGDQSPARLWAACGAMALTGAADGPPRGGTAGIAAAAVGAAAALSAVARDARDRGLAVGGLAEFDAAALLGERAALAGFGRRATISAGGATRLLRCRDGWLAVCLARDEDRQSLGAWLETSFPYDRDCEQPPWSRVAESLADREAVELEERAALLGMAVARATAPEPPDRSASWLRVNRCGRLREPAPGRPPRVVDLSSLWAGPLCSHLLHTLGADVIRVESRQRPDGARSGARGFYDLLNAGKRSVAFDFSRHDDVACLRRLIAAADIVIEGSRPRALLQLGIDAERLIAERPGMTWVSITGYGRDGAAGERVAFGDDAAVAAGLAVAAGSADAPVFCADAVADPLAGLHAALAALGLWMNGGGALADVPLRAVAAHALSCNRDVAPAVAFAAASEAGSAERNNADAARWRARYTEADGSTATVDIAPPRARACVGPAAELGADTRAVLAELDLSC